MIVIVDYDMGNVASVARAVALAGYECKVSANDEDLNDARGIILPGVGAFRDAMQRLSSRGLVEKLQRLVIEEGRTFVGFCLGMQLLATKGFEDGETPGFGWIPGEVKKIPYSGVRIPHMGWDNIEVLHPEVFAGVPSLDFYFMHSYYFDVADPKYVSSTVDYGGKLAASVRRDNIRAFQFHPEKSQAAGIALLKSVLAPC